MRDYAVARMSEVLAASSARDFHGLPDSVGFDVLAWADRFEVIHSLRSQRTGNAETEALMDDLATVLYGIYLHGDGKMTPAGSAVLEEWVRKLLEREAEVLQIMNREAAHFKGRMTQEALFIAALLANRLDVPGGDDLVSLARRLFSRELPDSSVMFMRSQVRIYHLLLALEQGDWREVRRIGEHMGPDVLDNQRRFVRGHSGMIVGRMDIFIWLRNWLDDPGARLLLDAYAAVAFYDQPDTEAILHAVLASSRAQAVDEMVRCRLVQSVKRMCIKGGYWSLFDEIVAGLEDPCDQSDWLMTLELLAAKGEVERLERSMSRRKDSISEEERQVLRAYALAHAGRGQDARAILAAGEMADVSDPHWLNQIAVTHARSGDIESAIALVRRIMTMEGTPNGRDAWRFEALHFSYIFAAYREFGASAEEIHRRIEDLGLRRMAQFIIWMRLATIELDRKERVPFSFG
ncbi:MAG: hypothetical protein JJU36_07880 [Phycisphaeraceae bacterium]|nr:hypothetical protein [Phycisphaeraceae bacterium]